MEHSAHFVATLDKTGKVIGKKLRRDLNKSTDTYHTIFILLVTPKGELVLGTIPKRSDLPNLYTGQMGAPMATIRRYDETAHQAALRGASRELHIDNPELTLLGEAMLHLDDSRTNLATVYSVISDVPSSHSADMPKLEAVSPKVFRSLPKDAVAPTLREIWRLYGDKLPI